MKIKNNFPDNYTLLIEKYVGMYKLVIVKYDKADSGKTQHIVMEIDITDELGSTTIPLSAKENEMLQSWLNK